MVAKQHVSSALQTQLQQLGVVRARVRPGTPTTKRLPDAWLARLVRFHQDPRACNAQLVRFQQTAVKRRTTHPLRFRGC